MFISILFKSFELLFISFKSLNFLMKFMVCLNLVSLNSYGQSLFKKKFLQDYLDFEFELPFLPFVSLWYDLSMWSSVLFISPSVCLMFDFEYRRLFPNIWPSLSFFGVGRRGSFMILLKIYSMPFTWILLHYMLKMWRSYLFSRAVLELLVGVWGQYGVDSEGNHKEKTVQELDELS